MKTFLKQVRKHLGYSALFSLFINVLYLTFPIYMLAIYDRVLSSYSMPTLITITVGALFALVIFGALTFLRSRLMLQAGNWMENSLNDQILSDTISDASRIKKIGYSQGLGDLNMLRSYVSGPAFTNLFDIPWTPFFLLLIYLLHPVLGIVATAGGVAIIILGVLQEMVTRKQINQANSINVAGRQFVAASLRNAEVINSLGMTDNITTHWNEKQTQVLQLQTSASNSAGILQSITRSLRMSMQVLIYGFGAWLTLKNESTAGIMISASIIMGRALAPIEQGMASWKQTIEARAAYRRLSALTQIPRDEKITDLPAPKGKLDVEGATLVLGGRTVLQNVSFSLAPGEALGLIGPSAAGKTSLCRMLLGIWPSMGGKVRLDGANVFQWPQEDLGTYLGYLPQDIELFPGTVSENIARMGSVDSEKVISAAKEAGVHEMILKLSLGYDTPIGEAGTILSGGQRQRIALARAIYGQPVFVVLDEPNSNLDDMGEKTLLETLSRMKIREITTVIVTHKPSLLAHVDKVLMLKSGQVAAFGPREDVFKQLMGPVQKQKILQGIAAVKN